MIVLYKKRKKKKISSDFLSVLCCQYVCEKLMEVYGIACSVKDVLNLDSSTEEKFSHHLIFLLPNAAFNDNIHVGMLYILQQAQKSDCLLYCFYIRNIVI